MSKKQKKLFIRIILSALAAVPCFFIPEKYIIARAIAFAVPYAIAGFDILLKAIRNIRNGQIFDENLLMGIATIGAYCLGEFSEAVMVVLLYQAGELFQSCAVSKSRKSIAALMDIRPDYANLVNKDGSYETVSPESVKTGDEILIKSGEKIPLDCIVTDGVSEIDTSSLTGESVPRAAAPGDALISGCVNISGTLRARVTKNYSESTVAKILELTENSAERKSKSENFITKFAKYYTPIVCFLALCMALIPTILYGSFTQNLKSALMFLVVSCPCALVVSVPLSFFCGIGCASKNGILVKGANFIESLSMTDTMIFDKTGTLTAGKFEVVGIKCLDGYDEEALLNIAARAEYYSDHPIASALKNAVINLSADGISESSQIIGKGIFAKIDGKEVYVGSHALMKQQGIICEESDDASTTLYVAVDGSLAGIISVADKIKPDAADTLKKLRRFGIKKTVMLTGDKKDTGEKIAGLLGIDEVHCQLLPADKVSLAEKIIKHGSSGRKTAYIGDGINDAPVLSRSDVGVAMGGLGSDAAIEAADVVIMDDSLSKLPTALAISRKTMRIVRQNITFAIGVKAAVMVLSALQITSNMWLAIFADVGVAILAILNALRTFNIKA